MSLLRTGAVFIKGQAFIGPNILVFSFPFTFIFFIGIDRQGRTKYSFRAYSEEASQDNMKCQVYTS